MKLAGLYGAHPLAVPPNGSSGATDFLEQSAAGKALVAICGAIAIVIVVISVFKMINGIGRGRPGEAFKSLIFGLLVGGLLFNLKLTIDGVDVMADVAGKIIASFRDITG